MSQFNTFYRALLDYKRVIKSDKEIEKNKAEFKKTDRDDENLTSTVYLCTIDNEWIEEIEKGMEFVVNAINEARQFIRTNGEIVPIEKVRKVSKDSVSHLARHSNMITKLPEDDSDIIPEKLYIVEKLSDYAVYENRFLYMLLCYIRDFMSLRLEKIHEILNSYTGKLTLNKNISLPRRNIAFTLNLDEVRSDNPYPLISAETKESMSRIENLQRTIESLLQTDLMIEVSKTPMVKPPITKTNVLKMNNNFKNALLLYEFVSGYTKDGYSKELIKKEIQPFNEEVSDDISDILYLSSFLTYEYGNDIKLLLKKEYDEEELKKKSNEQDKLIKEIETLKRRLSAIDTDPYEYILRLEERMKYLEEQELKYNQLKQEAVELNKTIDNLNRTISAKDIQIRELSDQVDDLKEALNLAEERRLQDIEDAKMEEAEKINNVRLEMEAKIDDINKYNQQLLDNETNLKLEAIAKVAELEANINSYYKEADKKIEQNYQFAQQQVDETLKECDDLKEKNTLLTAELNGIRYLHGYDADIEDYTSKERFNELEKQYAAFIKLFEDNYKEVKKKIRKEILWTKEVSKKEVKKLDD